MTLLDREVPLASHSAPGEAAVIALIAHARSVPSLRREAFATELAKLGTGPGHAIVHTCHRVELYVAPSAFTGELPDLPAGVERLEDAAAAEHLISVACGLDSAVLGETQILHQLREMFGERQADESLDPVLDRLFQAALRAGRSAHAWFSGSPRSLADVALDRIAAIIGPLEGRQILVVGVGRMGRLAAFAAMRRGCSVVITNRSHERAEQLAAEVGGQAIPFGNDDVLVDPDQRPAGAVVAIGGQWLVGPRDIECLVDLQIPVVDMSSPPAVPEALHEGLGTRSISVDDLTDDSQGPGERLQRRLETLVSRTGREYCQWIRTRDAVPAIQAVVSTAEQRRQAELDWLRRRLPDLAPDDLDVVEQMSHRLVAALLHAPLVALNDDGSGELERAARELFGV
jgi:glutamyl-tRNA reductase